MQNPLISCIVPVHNGERYLKEAIDSILAQTYSPLEIIVVDDGSTDETAAHVASYGEPVRYLWQPNAGPAAARNRGLSAMQGELVAFLDADDLWHPEKLARQMARFEARPEIGFSITHLQNFWAPELAQEADKFRDHRLAQPMPGYTCVTLLARRTVFERVGPFNAALPHGSDLEWFLRASDQGIIMEVLPDLLVYRRLHPTNRSRSRAATSRDTFLQILKDSLDRRRQQSPTASSDDPSPTPEATDLTGAD